MECMWMCFKWHEIYAMNKLIKMTIRAHKEASESFK